MAEGYFTGTTGVLADGSLITAIQTPPQGIPGPIGEYGLGYATIGANATIPADTTAVTLTITPNFFMADGATLRGQIRGIDGTLSRASGTYSFTRTSSGTATGVTANVDAFYPVGGSTIVYTLTNIAALKGFLPSPITAATRVYVAGYYTPGDGGGGLFYCDSSSVEADNGGTIIVSTTTPAVRWKRVDSLSGVTDVSQFGAIRDPGDNSTDSRTAFQNALNACKTVRFSGLYVLNGDLTINSDNSLIGSGATLRQKDSTATRTLFISGSRITIEGIKFEDVTPVGSRYAVVFGADSKSVKFHKISVATGNGIVINAANVSDVEWSNCYFTRGLYGIVVNNSATACHNIRIYNSTFIDIYADGIEINTPSAQAKNIIISGCYLHVPLTLLDGTTSPGGLSSGFGIGIAGGQNVLISDCVLKDSRRQGVHVEDPESRSITVENCVFDFNGDATQPTSGMGIQFLEGEDLVASGNVFYNCGSHGIVSDSGPGGRAEGIVISNNVIDKCVRGVTLRGPHSSVTGNLTKDCTTYGYTLGSGGTVNNVWANNRDEGSDIGFIFSYGQGTNFTNNRASGNPTAKFRNSGNTLSNVSINVMNSQGNAVGAVSFTTSAIIPIMDMGDYCKGQVAVTFVQSGNVSVFTHRIFDITWDGSTLTSTQLMNHQAGGVAFTLSNSGQTLRANCTFTGTITVLGSVDFQGVMNIRNGTSIVV